MEDPLSSRAYMQLPADAAFILKETSAPPRLLAHLVLVHDAAAQLIDQLSISFPSLSFDRDAVLFGASTHDIGKAVCTTELVEAGNEHEKIGHDLLRSMGISEDRARFAYTHGHWQDIAEIELEDLLVALADKCWKGKRDEDLESKTTELLSLATGKPAWECYAELDSILESLAQDASERLAWQASFSAARPPENNTIPHV